MRFATSSSVQHEFLQEFYRWPKPNLRKTLLHCQSAREKSFSAAQLACVAGRVMSHPSPIWSPEEDCVPVLVHVDTLLSIDYPKNIHWNVRSQWGRYKLSKLIDVFFPTIIPLLTYHCFLVNIPCQMVLAWFSYDLWLSSRMSLVVSISVAMSVRVSPTVAPKSQLWPWDKITPVTV